MSAFPVPVAPLYGALYLSSVMCTAFYGVACMQTFFYYIHYQDDPLRMKIFVAALWAVNTIYQALIVSGTYKYIIAGLEDPSSFLTAIPELIVQLLVMTPVALSTQGFFVYRIYIFSNKSLVAPFIWVILAIYQLAAALIYVTKALYSENGSVHVVPLSSLGDYFFTAISVSYCSVAAGIDVLIATFLTYLLVARRDSVSFKSTAKILERLTMFAINSGIWTAIFSLLTAILDHVLSSNLIYAIFFFPLCSIYCNTLLANLNARIYLRDETTPKNVDTDVLMSTFGPSIKFSCPDTDAGLTSSTDSRVQWKTAEVVTFSDAGQSSERRESVKTQAAEGPRPSSFVDPTLV